jgi:small conductance mechanosensitive channel
VIGRWIAKFIVRLVRKAMQSRQLDEILTRFICNILNMALLVAVVIAAMDQAGIQTTSFVAVLGAATLAIGFALQGSLSNFAAGVMIIIFRPFKVGDYVDAGGTAGIVEEVSVFATVFRTPDNKIVIVPNSSITGGNITNYSAKDTRRVDMVFGIGYGDDIAKAKGILERLVKEEERILADPEPQIAVAELADSSVNIVCRPWVKGGDYWPVFFDLTEKVKNEFDANDISIPFPQQDVHMHQVA